MGMALTGGDAGQSWCLWDTARWHLQASPAASLPQSCCVLSIPCPSPRAWTLYQAYRKEMLVLPRYFQVLPLMAGFPPASKLGTEFVVWVCAANKPLKSSAGLQNKILSANAHRFLLKHPIPLVLGTEWPK